MPGKNEPKKSIRADTAWFNQSNLKVKNQLSHD